MEIYFYFLPLLRSREKPLGNEKKSYGILNALFWKWQIAQNSQNSRFWKIVLISFSIYLLLSEAYCQAIVITWNAKMWWIESMKNCPKFGLRLTKNSTFQKPARNGWIFEWVGYLTAKVVIILRLDSKLSCR